MKIDPSKINNKFALAAVITLAFESLFFLWFNSANSTQERIAAGILASLVLCVFLFRIFSKEKYHLDKNAKKLIGKWEFESKSAHDKVGKGTLNISFSARNTLNISGVLYEDGEQIGTFNSEVARVNENRLIFYYILRDRKKMENMDAVSIVIFDPNEPNELNGDWIVASKVPRHGSVKYKRI